MKLYGTLSSHVRLGTRHQLLLLLTALTILLSGCAATFKYDNVVYTTPQAAIYAARADIDRKVAGVKASDRKVRGSLLIAIPTRAIMSKYGIVMTSSVAPTTEIVEYLTEVIELSNLAIAEVVRRGEIFDSVNIIRSNDSGAAPAIKYDYKLWLVGRSPTEWQWYFSKSGVDLSVPINVDNGLTGSARLASFNQAILESSALDSAVSNSDSVPPHTSRTASTNRRRLGFGTAFFINSVGFAVTNSHVVEACNEVRSVGADRSVAQTVVVATDHENDLALLKVNAKADSHAQFRLSPPIRQGEQITLYGYPLAGALASSGNLATGVVSALAGLYNDTRKMQISAPIQPGNSGAPLLDQSGNVIGVVSSKLDAVATTKVTGDIPQNVNFAIKSVIVTSFLEANGIGFDVTTQFKPLEVADIGDMAKAFTFMLECY